MREFEASTLKISAFESAFCQVRNVDKMHDCWLSEAAITRFINVKQRDLKKDINKSVYFSHIDSDALQSRAPGQNTFLTIVPL